MELQQALENIKRIKEQLAEQDIYCIREHKEEAIPVLLDYIKYIADNPDKIPVDWEGFDDQTYSLYLLAEFKVNEAFELFIKILEFDEETIDLFLEELLAEDYAQIIASVANLDNVNRLKVIVENEKIGELQRFCAVKALAVMYVEGVYPADEFFSYLEYLLNKNQDLPTELLSLIVNVCHEVFAEECFDIIRKLYEQDLIYEFFIKQEQFDEDHLYGRSKESSLEELKGNVYYTFIKDTVETMRHWAAFSKKAEVDNKAKPITVKADNKTEPKKAKAEKIIKPVIVESTSEPITVVKFGRNDPCPCGSGKKYKKCCIDKM